jgi:hypothetical protein
MNKDLHDIDELFRSALNDHEEAPSAGAKESLDAALDKKEAEEYKKRFIVWKRAALLLLLLLAGFVLYESGLIKNGSGNYTAKKSTPANDKKSGDKTELINQNKTIPLNTNAEDIITNQPVIQNNNGTVSSKVISTDKQVNQFSQKQEAVFSIFTSRPTKKSNVPADYETDLQTIKHRIESFNNQISKASITELLFKKIFRLSPVAVSSSPLNPENENNTVKNTPKKKPNPFKPFWMITPFVSYEQTGYKLDSDDPLEANVIRHREVHEPSFSGGLLATRQFTDHWGLQSGLVYTSTQIGISPQKMYALQLPGGDVAYKFITSSGYAYIKLNNGQLPAVGDSITTSDAKHLLKHISIPLTLKYKIGKNKLSVSPSAGIEANFITSAKVEVGVDFASNREVVTLNKLKGIKSFYWSAVTGVEASYQVSKKLSVNVQPVYRFALSPITKNNVVETFPRSFGIRAGVTIKF